MLVVLNVSLSLSLSLSLKLILLVTILRDRRTCHTLGLRRGRLFGSLRLPLIRRLRAAPGSGHIQIGLYATTREA